ncbi:hypothetical protein ACH3XW_6655 [Acanthocheilonema viteae]
MKSRCGSASNPSKKGTPKSWKSATPLRPVNQGAYRNSIRTKPLESSNRYSTVSEKENHLNTQDITQTLHKKAKPTAFISDELSSYEFTRNSDLKKTLSHVEEKFTSAAEELQAAEEELAELRVALNKAKGTIKILRIENEEQAKKIEFLAANKQKKNLTLNERNKEVSSVERISNKDLQILVNKLKEEKMALNLALENSKAEESRVVLENSRLKVIIEEERREWDQMQKDLLVTVKVANDFKIEAQKEMLKLSNRITELQRRRQSAAFTAPQGSSAALYEKNFQSWEDKAWHRLMLGCERGSRRNTLLRWCQEAVAKFSHIEITNFSSSWADGRALCSLLASFYPNKLNIDEIFTLEAEECLKLAIGVGADIGIQVKVEVADFRKDRPEWSLIMKQIFGSSTALNSS